MARKSLAEVLNGVTRYGRLTVVGEAENTTDRNGWLIRWVTAACDCGNSLRVRLYLLRSGQQVSCGCQKREAARKIGERTTKHGDSKGVAEYRIYRAMLGRCYNPNVERYPYYGGRGIKVCDRWRGEGGYERFLADMGRRPSVNLSLDRIDENGDYEPSNVRWADAETQANNKSNNRFIEVFGERLSYSQASRRYGLSAATIAYRIRAGVKPEAAVTERPKTGPNAKAPR